MIQPIGPLHVKVNDHSTYFVFSEKNLVFQWSVKGGEILNGQGTYKILVHWTNPGEGSVDVIQVDAPRSDKIIAIPPNGFVYDDELSELDEVSIL
jgi:hypothetical protein